MKKIIAFWLASCAGLYGATVMVDNSGRLVYPQADDFISANKLATLSDILAAGEGGGFPLVKIPMSKTDLGKPVEVELKVKEYGNPDAAYWFSTLKNQNYLEYPKRDVGAQAWFVCPRALLGFGDNRDYIPFLSGYWENISDQLTDMTYGVKESKYDDVSDALVEPNVGGLFLDGTKISDVWAKNNMELMPVYLKIGQAGAVGSWEIATVEWRDRKLKVPPNEGILLSGKSFKSEENSSFFEFGEEIEYLSRSEAEILFTSKDKVFSYYGKSIIAFTVEFPEFSGVASLRVGMLNRHTAAQSWKTTIYYSYSNGWYWNVSLVVGGDNHTSTTQFHVDNHFESAGTFSFSGDDFSGKTVRVSAFVAAQDHQFSVTREFSAGNIQNWSQTVKLGSPTYNILGIFSNGMPQGTKISNIKIITIH